MEQPDLFCDLCNIRLGDIKSKESHLLGKRHQITLHNAYIAHRKESCGIFVSGLPNVVAKDKIIKCFEEFGPVKSIHIGDGNKFAIVEFNEATVAQNLIKRKHIILMGKVIHVKPRILREQAEKVEVTKPDEDIELIHDSLKNHTDFDTQIKILLSKLQPNQEVHMQKYKQLCFDLETVLQEIFPDCKVYPFGSTITGLNFKNSDVDVYVEYKFTSNDKNAQALAASQFVKKARNALPKSRLFASVVAIPKAKTPIVKCVHVLTNVSCDFNFKNMLGVCNSYLIKYYLDLDKNLKSIIMVLKYWSKVHELTGNNGRFTNYSLAMLLIFYLQQVPYLLPTVFQMQTDKAFENLQEGWNGGFKPVSNLNNILQGKTVQEVLLGFFNFYSSFDYNLNIVCPYLGRVLPKTDFLKIDNLPPVYVNYKDNISNILPLQVENPLCVQDPFEHNHNLTKAISNKVLEEFISLCKLAAFVLKCNTVKNNILYKLFTDEPEDDKFRCSENVCEFKISMGNVLSYLKEKVPSDAENESLEIRKLWYETVNRFVISVLMHVFKFNVHLYKDDTKTKSQKIEGQSDIHESEFVDSVVFRCIGKQNLWEARKAIIKDLDLNTASGILNKQIYVTDYIYNVLCKDIVLTEPIVELTFAMNARDTPIQMEFVLTKIFAWKHCFKSLATFCGSKLPYWFHLYEKELNDSMKNISEGDKDVKT